VWFLADKGANLTRTTEHAHASLVLSAVRHRSTAALQQLKEYGVDLKHRHWNGNTVLHEAARMGEGEMVAWLLAHSDLDVNEKNDSGEGALAEASMMGHNDVIWKLLEGGAAFGDKGSGSATSILHSALRHSNTDLLDKMMEKGALTVDEINSPDKHGRLPLVEAVRSGTLTVIEWLIQHGANASVEPVGENAESAISVAASEDKFQILWRLHEAGAPLNVTNEYGGTPLMAAVHLGYQSDVLRLLDYGLDADHTNKRGDTPLSLAASRGDVSLMELLVARGATPRPRGPRADTPLHRASKFKKVDAVRYLLDSHQMDVNHQNRRGDTALHEACRAGSVGVTELLLKRGASVSHTNKQGMTPLLEAADSGSLEVIKMLVEAGADPKAVGKDETNAIEISRWTQHADEIKAYLVSLGVEAKEDEDDDESHRHDNPED